MNIHRAFLGWVACLPILCPGALHPPTASAAAERVAYLTFDDGPDPEITPIILNELKSEHVRATFFVLGFRSAESPQLVRRILRDGHEIGNHGYTHTFIVNKSRTWLKEDIVRADEAIEQVSGVRPQFFRPPGGILSSEDAGYVMKIGHPIAMWTVDTKDWRAKSADTIITEVMTKTRPGSIILMHDGVPSTGRFTATALPVLIHRLRARGFHFDVLPTNFHGEYMGRHTDAPIPKLIHYSFP